MSSPTQRSLVKLRKEGFLVAVVEKWNPHARIRQDLFGIFDLVAIRNGETVGIQTTAYSCISSRVKKMTEHENLPLVRAAGWRIIVHGWRKSGRNWVCREVDLS